MDSPLFLTLVLGDETFVIKGDESLAGAVPVGKMANDRL